MMASHGVEVIGTHYNKELVGDYPQLAKVNDESMKTNDYQPVFVLERIHEIMEAHGIKHLSAGGCVSHLRQ